MPRVMKPPTEYSADDIDTGADFYDGPPPTPGVYKGVVKKMLLTKVASGEKEGEQRIMVVCEITEGKFKGAGVSKWLQLTKQGSPWVNQFLHSLTDGSDEQKRAIRKAFSEVGFAVGDMDDKKRLPIIKIGKKTNPIGMTTQFVTKLRPGSDEVTRAEISRFLVPVPNDDDVDAEDALDGTDDDDLAAQLDDDADSDDDSDDDTTEDTDSDDSDDDSDASDSSDDGDVDDPWSTDE